MAKRKKKHHGVVVGAVTICAMLACSSKDPPPLSVSWVSTDRSTFDPSEETVRIRFRVSAPSNVTLKILDPYDRVVRKLEIDVKEPGDRELIWDGRTNEGQIVPSEAYTYTIAAERGKDEVVWDPRNRAGGEPVNVHSIEWSRETGKLAYALPEASRLRILLAKSEAGWPLRTLVDWKPRSAGKNQELWDGWDADRVFEAKEISGLVPVFSAYRLPENVVIVKGTVDHPPSLEVTEPVPQRIQDRRTSHLHAHHPRARCFERTIELSMDESLKTVEVSVPSEQGPARVRPLPRASVFIYVDGHLVHRELDATLPYRSYLEAHPPGEHILSALVTWREDHMGMKHRKVRWP